MRTTTKIVSAIAAIGLVAGAGLATAPANAADDAAATKVSGKTVIDLKPTVVAALATAGIGIKVIAPATMTAKPKVLVGFPVSGVSSAGVAHTGGVNFYSAANPTGITGMTPLVAMTGATTASVTVDVGGNAVIIMELDHVKQVAGKVVVNKAGKAWRASKTTTIRGDVHLTSDAGTVTLLNTVLGTTALIPGMGLGASKTTIVQTKDCKTKKGCTV